MTSPALHDAFATGADTAILGSSSMGQGIYETLGFRDHFECDYSKPGPHQPL
jgi:hypothetical protein